MKKPFSEKVMNIEYTMPKAEAAPILREMCASSLKKAMAEGDMIDATNWVLPWLDDINGVLFF